MQHSAMTWLVEGTKFVDGTLSEESKMIKQSFKEFINKASKEECRDFTVELFSALKNANVETVSDFINGGLPLLIKTVSNLSKMNEKSKAFATSLIAAFTKGYGQGAIEMVKNVKDSIFDTVTQKEKSIIGLVSKQK